MYNVPNTLLGALILYSLDLGEPNLEPVIENPHWLSTNLIIGYFYILTLN